jgi:hypothetical protein
MESEKYQKDKIKAYAIILALSIAISLWYASLLSTLDAAIDFSLMSILSGIGCITICGTLVFIILFFEQQIKNKIRQYMQRIQRLSIKKWTGWRYLKDSYLVVLLTGSILANGFAILLEILMNQGITLNLIAMLSLIYAPMILLLLRILQLREKFKECNEIKDH